MDDNGLLLPLGLATAYILWFIYQLFIKNITVKKCVEYTVDWFGMDDEDVGVTKDEIFIKESKLSEMIDDEKLQSDKNFQRQFLGGKNDD